MKIWIYILAAILGLLISITSQTLAASSCAKLNISSDSTQTFEIPIKKGKGCAAGSKPNPTCLPWFEICLKDSINGTGNIISPKGGTWTITAQNKDHEVSFKPSNSNITSNKEIKWETKIWNENNIRVDAVWSKEDDTTLKIRLKAN